VKNRNRIARLFARLFPLPLLALACSAAPEDEPVCVQSWAHVAGECRSPLEACQAVARAYTERMIIRAAYDWGSAAVQDVCEDVYLGGRDFKQNIQIEDCDLTCNIRFDGNQGIE
jgi:hypothetical protein